MRRFLVTFLLVTSTLPLFAGNGQKLGGLMSKYYALMKQDDQALVLITFEDRGANRSFSPSAAPALLSARAIQRRLKMRSPSKLIDESDLPLDQSYVSGVASHVTTLRHQLKWFNGVSALATRQQIDELLR